MVMQIIENALLVGDSEDRSIRNDKNEMYTRSVMLRITLITGIFVLAYAAMRASGVGAAFNKCLTLVGGVANSLLGLVFPPIMFMRAKSLVGEDIGLLRGTVLALISLLGILLLVSSIYFVFAG